MDFPASTWSLIIHNMEEGIVIFDTGLRVVEANKSALKLLGFGSIKGFKDGVDKLFEADIRELVLSGVDVLNAPMKWQDPAGEETNLLRTFIPVIEEENVEGVILLIKPGLVYFAPPMESWLEWGRNYLNQVTANLHEAICYLDHEGRIIYANCTFEDIVDRELPSMVGRTLASVLKPVSRPLFLMEVLERTLRDGSWQGEFEIQTGLGHRSLLATAAVVRSERGRDLGIAILARDITERKHLEEEMKRRIRELSIIYDLLQLTAGYHDMEETLKESLYRILSIMRAEAGAVYLRDWETDELHLVVYQGLTYNSAKDLTSGEKGKKLAEKVLAGSGGMIVNQAESGGQPALLSGRRGPLMSLAAVPISSRGRKSGVLMAGHKRSSHFGLEDLSVLLSLASQVGVVFELTDLLDDLRGKLEELGRERDFSRAVVDTMPSALALLDSRGRFTFVNRRFTDLLGYTLQDMEGRPFSTILPGGTRKKTMRDIMVRAKTGSRWMEARITGKSGGEMTVLLTSSPQPLEGGEYQGVIVTITDLTSQRETEKRVMEIEEEAEALSRELAGTKNTLKRLDARKQAYLSMVHHEIATPLKLIKKGIRELDKGVERIPTEEARSRLELLQREVSWLERLTSDIRDVSAMEKGKLRLRRRETDLRDLTCRAVEEMSLTGRNPISLELPEVPLLGLVDAARVDQVLTSLIDNAMKFSPAGSEIIVRLLRKNDIAYWEVEDRGKGMDSQQLQILLELLVGGGRGGHELKTGLGLFICHHIVQAHAGDLRFESKPGEGTRVSVSIPLRSGK